MKKLFLIALCIGVGFVAQAQTTRDVGTFKSVEVTDKIQVELIQAAAPKIEIEGENNENVDIVNKNESLKIKMNTLNMLQGDAVSVKVYYVKLNAISAKKGAKLVAKKSAVITTEDLQVSAAEGALIQVPVDAQKVSVKATSGANVTLEGKSVSQDAIVNLGAVYDGREMNSETAFVTVNGGGSIDVRVKTLVDAKTRAGGTINVYGNPTTKNQKTFAGGVINFK